MNANRSQHESTKNESTDRRRAFLKFGLASGVAAVAATVSQTGCDQELDRDKPSSEQSSRRRKQGVDMEKWQQIRGEDYITGDGPAPGVCKLPGPNAKRNWPDMKKYENVTKVPGMCQLCSTICGTIGYVKEGRLIKIEGNPNDPNSRGYLCARGHAGLNHLYHPERLLYPLKRVGKRGEGKWKRISWDEALDEIAEKLKKVRDSGHPEKFAFHQGRQRSKDALKRFLDAFGTKTQLSHRSLCRRKPPRGEFDLPLGK